MQLDIHGLRRDPGHRDNVPDGGKPQALPGVLHRVDGGLDFFNQGGRGGPVVRGQDYQLDGSAHGELLVLGCRINRRQPGGHRLVQGTDDAGVPGVHSLPRDERRGGYVRIPHGMDLDGPHAVHRQHLLPVVRLVPAEGLRLKTV